MFQILTNVGEASEELATNLATVKQLMTVGSENEVLSTNVW